MIGDIEAMETIFAEIAYALQAEPSIVLTHMEHDIPRGYEDGVYRAAALVSWLMEERIGKKL